MTKYKTTFDNLMGNPIEKIDKLVDEAKKMTDTKKWSKSRINDSWQMTKIEGQAITVRKPNWFEKLLIKFRLI